MAKISEMINIIINEELLASEWFFLDNPNDKKQKVSMSSIPYIKTGKYLKGLDVNNTVELINIAQERMDEIAPLTKVVIKGKTILIDNKKYQIPPSLMMIWRHLARQKVEHCTREELKYCGDCNDCYLDQYELIDTPETKINNEETSPDNNSQTNKAEETNSEEELNLLCGLITPSSGEISIDGVSYNAISISALQRSIGYVTQESAVFNGNLTENLTLWETQPDMQRVENILEQLELQNIGEGSKASTFGNHLIGGDGAQLSGGERQRIGIARELYRNPAFMILDEATSALDSKLEQKIDELLESQRGNKTFLIIAHRLSTIRNADLIYVLDEGKVVESGSFDELVAANNLFARMIKMQEF